MTSREEIFSGFNFSPHAHIELIVSLKPWLNCYSFRWLNLSLKRRMSFAPSGS